MLHTRPRRLPTTVVVETLATTGTDDLTFSSRHEESDRGPIAYTLDDAPIEATEINKCIVKNRTSSRDYNRLVASVTAIKYSGGNLETSTVSRGIRDASFAHFAKSLSGRPRASR